MYQGMESLEFGESKTTSNLLSSCFFTACFFGVMFSFIQNNSARTLAHEWRFDVGDCKAVYTEAKQSNKITLECPNKNIISRDMCMKNGAIDEVVICENGVKTYVNIQNPDIREKVLLHRLNAIYDDIQKKIYDYENAQLDLESTISKLQIIQ